MNLIFLCGAGGAGKTSVLLELGKNKRIDCISSSSRNTFARLGIEDEEASLKLSYKDRQNLQTEILKDYMKAVTSGLYSACFKSDFPHDTIVVDRSPYDHLFYWLRTFSMNPSFEVDDYRILASSIHKELIELPAAHVFFADFYAPTSWAVPDDGQRSSDEVKRLQASLQITGILCQEVNRERHWHYQAIPEDTVERRAIRVLDFVKKHSDSLL